MGLCLLSNVINVIYFQGMMSVPISFFYSLESIFSPAVCLCLRTLVCVGATIVTIAKRGVHHPRGAMEESAGDAHTHRAPPHTLSLCTASLIFAFHALLLPAGFVRHKQAQHVSPLSFFPSFFLSFLPISRLEAKVQLIQDFTSVKSCSASVLRKRKPFISKQGNRALKEKKKPNPFSRYMSQL